MRKKEQTDKKAFFCNAHIFIVFIFAKIERNKPK